MMSTHCYVFAFMVILRCKVYRVSHSSFHGFDEGKSLYKHVISQEYGFKETDFCHCL